MTKFYIEPQFEFIRTDEQNKVFFAASGVGPTTTTTTDMPVDNQFNF